MDLTLPRALALLGTKEARILVPTIYKSLGMPFQDPKLEVPTIYKAYVREYPHKIWPYIVQYLHFRILEFPLINGDLMVINGHCNGSIMANNC